MKLKNLFVTRADLLSQRIDLANQRIDYYRTRIATLEEFYDHRLNAMNERIRKVEQDIDGVCIECGCPAANYDGHACEEYQK